MKRNRVLILLSIPLLVYACQTDDRSIYESGNLVPHTVERDTTLPAITVNNIRLHAEAYGPPDSTIVLCLHGGPGSDYRYMLPCSTLADQGYRVVFYDQMGAGLSQRMPKAHYEAYGSQLLNAYYDEISGVIAHYRTHPDQKVYLLGHSWGGMLATGFTGNRPNEVQGLVVCEPGGLVADDISHYIQTSQAFSIWGELSNDATYQDQFLTIKDENFLGENEDDHAILDYKAAIKAPRNEITNGHDSPIVPFWRYGILSTGALLEAGKKYGLDLSAGIGNYSTPVLFLYSGNNNVYTDSWAAHVSEPFQQVLLYKVNGVGHDGIVSDPYTWEHITQPRILQYFQSL